ncbi:MAG: decaprenyl-phosphate phosphoribosyltransferase [Candidatus Aminicenantes bacterium]|nr:decaprenyl-phosphate phosphoribosyltransferase [Candidatus Aminicenantes bacterium]
MFDLLKSLRPAQWTKNLFVFAALVFSKGVLIRESLLRSVWAFAVFCLLSGALYLINDVVDVEEDRRHPKKRLRPIAAGRVSRGAAIAWAGAFGAAALAGAFALGWGFGLVASIYAGLVIAYTFALKHIVILDVFLIASGFVLRVIAGGLAIAVPLSSWLIICTSLLSLFIAFGKRRHEIVSLDADAPLHRPILNEYSAYLLDQMISVVTASTVIAYCLYTVSEETVRKFGTSNLILTTPFVLYGVFRYLYLVHQKGLGGSPEEMILRDKPLAAAIVLWIAAVIVILYFR